MSIRARPQADQALVASDGAQEVSTLSGFDPSRLEDAIAFAAHCHKGQRDKGGQPYILHPLRVMMKLDDEDKRIAAVLHDVIEDCGVEPVYIRMGYGDSIGDAVEALTRGEDEPYEDFIERCGANDIARAVKWADLCDNMDLSRLPKVTETDFKRHEKYRAARDRLTDIAIALASADTHPKDGDSTEIESPLVSGAVPEGQTPNPSNPSRGADNGRG